MKGANLLIDLEENSLCYSLVGPDGALSKVHFVTHGQSLSNLPAWVAAVRGALAELAKNKTKYQAVINLPYKTTSLHIEDVSGYNAPDKDLVALAANKQISTDLHYSGYVRNTAGREALVVGVSNELIRRLGEALRELGIQILSLRCRVLQGANLAKVLQGNQMVKGSGLWVHLERNASWACALYEGEIAAIETVEEANVTFNFGETFINPSYDKDPSGNEWNSALRANSMGKVYKRLEGVLRRLLGHLDNLGKSPTAVWVSGPLSAFPEVSEILGTELNLTPHILRVSANPQFTLFGQDSILEARSTLLASLNQPSLELLPPTKKSSGETNWKTVGIAVGAFAGVLLGISLTYSLLIGQQNRLNQQLSQDLAALQPYIEEARQLRSQIAVLDSHLAIRDSLYALRVDWPEVIGAFMSNMPAQNVGIESFRVARGNESASAAFAGVKSKYLFSLAGKARSKEDLDRLLLAFQTNPRYGLNFQSAQLQQSNQGWQYNVEIADQGLAIGGSP